VATRRNFPIVRRSGSRRATDWSLGITATAEVAVPANSSVLLASIAASALSGITPSTLIRTRGLITVTSDQVVTSELQIGGVGLTFVSERARAAGVGSLPRPVSEFGWEGWFMHQFIAARVQVATAVGFDAQMYTQYPIDSRAMRKFDDDSALVLVGENTHATHALNLIVFLRMLVKAG